MRVKNNNGLKHTSQSVCNPHIRTHTHTHLTLSFFLFKFCNGIFIFDIFIITYYYLIWHLIGVVTVISLLETMTTEVGNSRDIRSNYYKSRGGVRGWGAGSTSSV